jgi:hypothetical protein
LLDSAGRRTSASPHAPRPNQPLHGTSSLVPAGRFSAFHAAPHAPLTRHCLSRRTGALMPLVPRVLRAQRLSFSWRMGPGAARRRVRLGTERHRHQAQLLKEGSRSRHKGRACHAQRTFLRWTCVCLRALTCCHHSPTGVARGCSTRHHLVCAACVTPSARLDVEAPLPPIA